MIFRINHLNHCYIFTEYFYYIHKVNSNTLSFPVTVITLTPWALGCCQNNLMHGHPCPPWIIKCYISLKICCLTWRCGVMYRVCVHTRWICGALKETGFTTRLDTGQVAVNILALYLLTAVFTQCNAQHLENESLGNKYATPRRK